MSWETDPFARWGLFASMRDGVPSVPEASLWELERLHPEVVERDGDDMYLHLDQPWRVVQRPDRSFLSLFPAPGRARPPRPAPPGGEKR